MIKMSEYAKRRKALLQLMGPEGILFMPSGNEVGRNGDTVFPFRQYSDFYYLTGFEEPEAMLVLSPKRAAGEFILFNRKRDRSKEIWDGPRAGQQGAVEIYQADESFQMEEFQQMLALLLMGKSKIYYPIGISKFFDMLMVQAINQAKQRVRSGVDAPQALIDIAPYLHDMRLHKSAAEIAIMEKASSISASAHTRAMQTCKPGMYEYQLEATLLHEFCHHGARQQAYNAIIGSGPNSCILHYNQNNRQMQNGELVLIDAGCEYQNYASDITRTFPVNGKFSAEQRAIYEIVLAAQVAGIKACKVGTPWPNIQQTMVKIITAGLIDVGLLKGKLEDLIEKQAYRPFYMHNSGHWLGLDVHDVGSYKVNQKWRKLTAGIVLTVEPGIYISADIPNVPKKWHNIGVRIEDDIVVTEKGPRVLGNVVKTVVDIEALMRDS